MSQTLYRKYRPQTWADVAGQNHVKTTLEFEVATGRIAHAYLFSGPRGVGKTTIARIMAKALNCLGRAESKDAVACGACASCVAITENAALDVIEIDAASHRGIDAVRDNVIEHARFAPAKLKYKVFIIDEVHMLTTEAFNALLKTLEEPPKNVVFILATTELHKVPATIVSRCQRFDFRKIPFTDLVERLHALAEREKCKVDRRTLEEIARHSDGCLRDAEGLLGKVMAMGDGKHVSYDQALVVLPRSEYAALASFTEALLRRDARTALGVIGDCLEGGADLEQFAGDATELLRKTLLAKLAGSAEMFAQELDEERKTALEGWVALAETASLVQAIETLLEKKQDMKRAHPVQLPLELAVVRICESLSAAREDGATSDASARRLSGDGDKSTVAHAVSRGSVTGRPSTLGEPVSATLEQPPTPARQTVPAVTKVEIAEVPATVQAGRPELERIKEAVAALVRPAVAFVEVPTAVVEVARVADDAASSAVVRQEAEGGHVTTVQALKARWAEFVQRAGEENAAFSFLLGVGEPAEVAGNMVRIGFDFAFHRDKMNEEKHRRVLEKVLGTLLGKPVKIEGVVTEQKRGIGSEGGLIPGAYGTAPVAAPGRVMAGGDGLAAAFGGRVVE
jgi:DNA polymerase-3 subunit gamma/tau